MQSMILLSFLASVTIDSPDSFETSYVKGTSPLVVTAKIGNDDKRVALSTTDSQSYVIGTAQADGTVSFSGHDITRITRTNPSGPFGADAVLGLDVLRNMAIGVDLLNGKVTIWPKGNLAESDAVKWLSLYAGLTEPHFGSKSIPLPRAGDAFAVPVGEDKSLALLQIGLYGTKIGENGPSVPSTPEKTSGRRIASTFKVASQDFPWFAYISAEDAAWKKFPTSKPVTITLEALRSRRILIDFAASRLYFEDTPPDGILSMILTEWFGVPFRVYKDSIYLKPLADEPWPSLSEYLGSEVIELAGLKTPDLLAILRNPSSESRTQLITALESRLNFEVWIRMPSGKELIIKPQRG